MVEYVSHDWSSMVSTENLARHLHLGRRGGSLIHSKQHESPFSHLPVSGAARRPSCFASKTQCNFRGCGTHRFFRCPQTQKPTETAARSQSSSTHRKTTPQCATGGNSSDSIPAVKVDVLTVSSRVTSICDLFPSFRRHFQKANGVGALRARRPDSPGFGADHRQSSQRGAPSGTNNQQASVKPRLTQ